MRGTSRRPVAVLFVLTLVSFVAPMEGQTSTAGPNYAGGAGTNGFTSPGNAVGSDQSLCATVYGTSWSGFWNNFGFSVPSNATIQGIRVELMQGWRDDPPLANSLGVVIGKNATNLATEKRGGAQTNRQTCSSTGMPIDTYGAASDLWGLGWTPSEINSSAFTVRIRNADGQEFGINLNWIRVTVTYTASSPSLTLSKTVNPLGTQVPGTDLNYAVTITNTGAADAVDIVVVDTLPGQVDFKVGSVVSNLPAGVSVLVEYSDDGGSTWSYAPTSAGCGAPVGYDRCVSHIRWRLLNNLSSVAPSNTGDLAFFARIR